MVAVVVTLLVALATSGAAGAAQPAASDPVASEPVPSDQSASDPAGPSAVVAVAASAERGLWTVDGHGVVAAHRQATHHGDPSGVGLWEPIVGMAATPSGRGYWLVASDGGVFTYGDAAFHGSAGGIDLWEPIVGMAATPSGRGYWLVASDGGVFTYGDAAFHGSAGDIDLESPIIGMAATPSGLGYWLVASDGGVFTYGDASFHGSTGGQDLAEPITGVVATEGGDGYWLVDTAGRLFTYGAAAALTVPPLDSGARVASLGSLPDGTGLVLVLENRASVVLGFPRPTADDAARVLGKLTGDRLATWEALARCESGGDWAINTGNGYYGGLQFSADSWRGVGGTGLPHQHSREEQIYRGELLLQAQGWGAWPACARLLGLR